MWLEFSTATQPLFILQRPLGLCPWCSWLQEPLGELLELSLPYSPCTTVLLSVIPQQPHVHPEALLPLFHPLLQPTGALTQSKNTIWDTHLVDLLGFNLWLMWIQAVPTNVLLPEAIPVPRSHKGGAVFVQGMHCFTEILNRQGRECHSRMASRHVQCAITVLFQPKDSYKVYGIGTCSQWWWETRQQHLCQVSCHEKGALSYTPSVNHVLYAELRARDTHLPFVQLSIWSWWDSKFLFRPISKHIYMCMCVCVTLRSKLKQLENPI